MRCPVARWSHLKLLMKVEGCSLCHLNALHNMRNGEGALRNEIVYNYGYI